MSRDVQARLTAALLARGGAGCALVEARQRPWASVTFEGARHALAFALAPGAVERFVAGIEEAEIALPRHLLADLAVVERAATAGDRVLVRIEALTLRDR